MRDSVLAYSETPEWRDHVMYVDALVDEAAKKSIQKIIKQFRSEGRDDQSTLDFLINIYGDQYSEVDLKKFIEEAK